MYLFPATADMGVLLIEVLVQHNISYEPCANLIALPGVQDASRVVALLRQILSEPERQELSVFQSDGREFPRPKSLDDWWRVYQTNWFATALAENRFTTWFQPIVDTNGQRALAHECLIRLQAGRTYADPRLSMRRAFATKSMPSTRTRGGWPSGRRRGSRGTANTS